MAGKAVLATDWSSDPRKTAINKDSSAIQGMPLGAGGVAAFIRASGLGRFQRVPCLQGHLAGGLLEVVTARCVEHGTR